MAAAVPTASSAAEAANASPLGGDIHTPRVSQVIASDRWTLSRVMSGDSLLRWDLIQGLNTIQIVPPPEIQNADLDTLAALEAQVEDFDKLRSLSYTFSTFEFQVRGAAVIVKTGGVTMFYHQDTHEVGLAWVKDMIRELKSRAAQIITTVVLPVDPFTQLISSLSTGHSAQIQLDGLRKDMTYCIVPEMYLKGNVERVIVRCVQTDEKSSLLVPA